MNNKPFLFTLLVLITISMSFGCGSEDQSLDNKLQDDAQEMNSKIDTSLQDVGQETIVEPEIPEDEERKENLKKAASKSPFATLGCCDTEDNYGEDCCCDEVIDEYRNMVAAEDTSIARLKMTDPILSKCRKKHQDTFDEIDNPGDDLDGLLGTVLSHQ